MIAVNSNEFMPIQLDLLQEAADFCDNNSIRYYLSCGMHNGAIRHKGYILWDDDIDIVMPKPDYDRFLNTFNMPDDYYQVVNLRTF